MDFIWVEFSLMFHDNLCFALYHRMQEIHRLVLQISPLSTPLFVPSHLWGCIEQALQASKHDNNHPKKDEIADLQAALIPLPGWVSWIIHLLWTTLQTKAWSPFTTAAAQISLCQKVCEQTCHGDIMEETSED